MKRERYDDEIPFECNTCGEKFPVEGYYEPDGEGCTIIVTARRGHVICPNDGISQRGRQRNKRIDVIPVHDVNYRGDTL